MRVQVCDSPLFGNSPPPPQGLEGGHPELLLWRDIDTEVNDDPSDMWYNLTISSSSIFNFMANTHQSTMLNISYTGLIFDHGIS